MSEIPKRGDPGLHPQVMVMEEAEAPVAGPLAPRLIATAQTGRIAQAAPLETLPAPIGPRPRRRSHVARLAALGITAALVGWIGIDLYLWIGAAFTHSPSLGWLASAAAAAGVLGAGALVVRELKSFLALKAVEANQQRFAVPPADMRAGDMQDAIRRVIAVIPRDRESNAAIEAFQRKVQRHHSPAQQLDLFSQTVMSPLDRRAEAIVRRAGARAFGITAISPTAITDALFFLACAIRLVRDVAASYGHRPTASATIHLLRRLVVEAGKLGAVDLAGATLAQHLGGAVAERVAASAAGSVYAAQRMTRLGLVTMALCRPVPFRPSEVPGLWSSLVGHLFARPAASSAGERITHDNAT
jgi:putative membrane protein